MPKSKRKNKQGSKATAFSSTQPQRGGFPDKQRVKLVYSDLITRTHTSVTGSDYVFSANGCFDPDITGTGAQPANFDDFSAIYSRYRVFGSSIDLLLQTPGSSTGAGQFYLALAARHTTTAKTTLTSQLDASSMPMSTDLLMNGGLATTPSAAAHISMSQTTSRVLGYERVAIATDDTLQALTSANPAHQWYWHIMSSMTDQSSSGTLWFRVRIVYDVEFFDRIDTIIDSSVVTVPRTILPQVMFMVRETEKKETKEDLPPQRSGAR